MKVLVTGATGFIGNYVVEELLSCKDIEIVASARSLAKAKNAAWYPKVQFVEHAIEGDSVVEDLFEKFYRPDALIHLAWSGLPNYKQLFHFEQVLPAQYFFLKTLISQGLRDITVTGTCFEYGMQEGSLSESMVALPANPYALAKDTLRRFLESLQQIEPFSMKWTRLFYMYGKGQSQTSILSLLEKAIEAGDTVFNMSGGEQVRDYLPVEKVAGNIVSIALQNKVTGIINCSSNQPITIRQLVEEFLLKTGSDIKLNFGFYPYPDYEPFCFYGDNTKLNSIIHE